MDQLSLLDDEQTPAWKLARRGVLAGTCSWAEETMLTSEFYPSRVKSSESRLRYYALQFPIVEIDSSYYAIPAANVCRNWALRTPPDFTFNLKSFSLFTRHSTQAAGLPKDLRERAPSDNDFVFDDCSSEFIEACWERFCDSASALESKLEAVLFQFPPWFVASVEARTHIESIAQRMREDLPNVKCAIEFRHKSWTLNALRCERTFGWLADQQLPYVAVDEPQGFSNSVPPLFEVTNSDLAIVRFHGRNTSAWNVRGATTTQRFDWTYTDTELREWTPRVVAMQQSAKRVHVLMNNCHSDQAPNAARDFVRLLTAE